MRVNPDQGLQFAQMLVQDEEPLANINQVNAHTAAAAAPPPPHTLTWRRTALLLVMLFARLSSHMHANTQ